MRSWHNDAEQRRALIRGQQRMRGGFIYPGGNNLLPTPSPAGLKPAVIITGMQGFGDNLHQRAILRVLLKDYEVWLESCHASIYHDMLDQGLKIMRRNTSLFEQTKTLQRDAHLFTQTAPPQAIQRMPRIWYSGADINAKSYTILASMFASCGVPMPQAPDFSWPLKDEWRAAARKLIASWDTRGKPLLIYRPIVVKREWSAPARNPDPAAYAALFAPLREHFFTVSVASLRPGQEWIEGPEQATDVKLHSGQLDFPTLGALFAEAKLVYANPGFAPVLAQAVGTPVITVFGGRECYAVTDIAGAHLAPTLGIDPDNPCRCFSHTHRCDKRITLPPAQARVLEFVGTYAQVPTFSKPPLYVVGMWGIGDCIYERSILKELMKAHTVFLEECHYSLAYDLIEQGLRVQKWCTFLTKDTPFPVINPPPSTPKKVMGYPQAGVEKHGSILAAMFGEFGLKVNKPDFSLPVKPQWRAKANALIRSWNIGDKPLLIYRPNTARKQWSGSNGRTCDVGAYNALYQDIRGKFFVVSTAKVGEKGYQEWIEGPEQACDVNLNRGELDFETMLGLYSEADMVFTPSCFAPVLAQAVGTPSVVIYGGKERYSTTNAAGAHLAPTLGIDVDHPTNFDYTAKANYNRTITLPPAREKIAAFLEQYRRPRTLIFCTNYVDNDERARVFDYWLTIATRDNPRCDVLVVDTPSSRVWEIDPKWGFIKHEKGLRAPRMFYRFPDNIGHLNARGRDGWGRAFSYGLWAAVDSGYDYVVHIEGDLLFKPSINVAVKRMRNAGIVVASPPVRGTEKLSGDALTETGVMFFSTAYLQQSRFIEFYAWPGRHNKPAPEAVVYRLISNVLRTADWQGLRNDKDEVTVENVVQKKLDYITHCKDVRIYDKFMEQ